MAKKVDKEQKKQDIALACKDIVVKNGIGTLSIATLAKEAGIGKGTIYDYFKNKEEIVFTIANILLKEHHQKLKLDIEKQISIKDKIKKFSEFFYTQEEFELREIYKEFIALSLVSDNQEIKAFQTQQYKHYYSWFLSLIEEGVQTDELIPEARELCRGFFAVGNGLFLAHSTTSAIDNLEFELHKFIDTIFEMIKVKK